MKPEESNSFDSTPLSLQQNSTQNFNDTYAEWDTLETINSIKEAIELFHDVTMIEANEDALSPKSFLTLPNAPMASVVKLKYRLYSTCFAFPTPVRIH